MNQKQPPFIVVTDLDGTLLDHHSYSWQAAADTLAVLKEKQIPIIINTSKTFAEVLALQASLGLESPFIVENGSAVFLPKKAFAALPSTVEEHQGFYCKLLGQQRQQLVRYLQALRSEKAWEFAGYSDWSVAQVMALTGLDSASAELSLARAFSEPLIWQDSAENLVLFKQALEKQKLTLLKGGRFYHVLGSTNKGVAVQWVQSLYAAGTPVVCLGDSPNDIEMLDVADIPVWVKSDKHDYPELSQPNPRTICTPGVGPIGWAEALTQIIKQFK